MQVRSQYVGMQLQESQMHSQSQARKWGRAIGNFAGADACAQAGTCDNEKGRACQTSAKEPWVQRCWNRRCASLAACLLITFAVPSPVLWHHALSTPHSLIDAGRPPTGRHTLAWHTETRERERGECGLLDRRAEGTAGNTSSSICTASHH